MTDLGAVRSDQIQRSHGAVQETRDLQEVVVSDGPGAVDQERQVSLGLLAHWTDKQTADIYAYLFSQHMIFLF